MLTMGSMSSDESGEDDKGRNTYTINKLLWCNKEITRMLRFVDQNHNTTNTYGNTRGSNPPHVWILWGRKESMRDAVPGLPKNFYDHTWYMGLLNKDKKELNAKPPIKLPDIVEEA
jgi:hypothetical protein